MNYGQNIHENGNFNESLKRLLKQKADKLMVIFIKEGPDALKEKLGITYKKHWKAVFDYLVFSEDVLKRCVVEYMPYFKQMIEENGPLVLKKMFQIEDPQYNEVFERIFDLVAVANGALYDHVYLKRKKYSFLVIDGRAANLREDLGLLGSKYSQLWHDILDLLQEAVCNKIYDNNVYDRGLLAFTRLISVTREHRSLRSYKQMWAYSAKEAE